MNVNAVIPAVPDQSNLIGKPVRENGEEVGTITAAEHVENGVRVTILMKEGRLLLGGSFSVGCFVAP